MPDWNKIGHSLAGLGAGMQGRGTEYMRLMQRDALIKDERRRQALFEDAYQYTNLMQMGQPDQARRLIVNRVKNILDLNGDPRDTTAFLGLHDKDPDAAFAEAASLVQAGMASGYLQDPSTRNQVPAGIQEFQYLTRLVQDPNTPEQIRDAAMVKLGTMARAGMPVSTNMGGVPGLHDRDTNTFTPATMGGVPITPETVAATKGTVRGGEEAGKQAVTQSGKIFEQLSGISTSIANYDAAIAQINKGADTGAVAQHFPSFTEASVTLDNIRSQMGLDIIGATTFGSLSEKELEFALDTAMPTGLDEPALREWLIKKRNAQKKLRQELHKAAIYLGKPGNTVAGYLESLEKDGKYGRRARTVEEILRDYP